MSIVYQSSLQSRLADRDVISDNPSFDKKLKVRSSGGSKDQQIAELFSAMRRASSLNTTDLATRLQTTPELIEALETGDLSYLPEWEETAPVVIAYANLVNIDDRPILRHLRERLTAHFLNELSHTPKVDDDEHSVNSNPNASTADFDIRLLGQGRTQSLPPVPKSEIRVNDEGTGTIDKTQHAASGMKYSLENFVSAPPQTHHKTQSQTPTPTYSSEMPINYAHGHISFDKTNTLQRGSRIGRIAANIIFIVVFIAVFISWQPNRFWSGIDKLPQPISSSIYSALDFVIPSPLASLHKMQWINVADPRMRKTDKLPVPSPKKLPSLNLPLVGK